MYFRYQFSLNLQFFILLSDNRSKREGKLYCNISNDCDTIMKIQYITCN